MLRLLLLLVVLVSLAGCAAPAPVPAVVSFCNSDAPRVFHYETRDGDEAKATGNLLVERGWSNVTVQHHAAAWPSWSWSVDAVCRWLKSAPIAGGGVMGVRVPPDTDNGSMTVTPVQVPGIQLVPGVGRAYRAYESANPLNHEWRRVGGVPSQVKIEVHLNGNLAPALFIGWAQGIPGVVNFENYPYSHDVLVEVASPSVRDSVAGVLLTWPDVWFVEPAFTLNLGG